MKCFSVFLMMLFSLCFFPSNVLAVNVAISGRVINEYHTPLSGCIVTLSGAKMNDTTDINGQFSMNNIKVSVNPSERVALFARPQISGTTAKFSITKAMDRVELKVFDLRGRSIFHWHTENLGAGDYELPIQQLIGGRLSQGIFIANLIAGNQRVTSKISFSKRNMINQTNPSSMALNKETGSRFALRKTQIAAAVDTLIFQLNKYETKKIILTSYFDTLGDIALTINTPPDIPQPLFPTNGQTGIDTIVSIKWECTDKNNDSVFYQLLLDTITPPVHICSGFSRPDTLNVKGLKALKTYYWRIIATDNKDTSRSSVFSFITRKNNSSPSQPQAITPVNNHLHNDTTMLFRWSCSDQDGDSIYYKVLLDTVSPPVQMVQNFSYTDSIMYGGLRYEKIYHWQIIATDRKDTIKSAILTFSTHKANTPPSVPNALFPVNAQTGISTDVVIKWESNDIDKDTLNYKVLLDTLSPPVSMCRTFEKSDSLQVKNLIAGKTYYWRVISFDGKDSTRSTVFTFTTRPLSFADDLLPTLRKQCFIIGLEVNGKIAGLGSGFAVSKRKIMTNAHVAKGLIDFISNYDMTGIKLIAVRDGGRINVDNSFELDSFAIHQEYDSTKQYTYDFSLLTIKSGVLTDTCNFESTQQLYNLAIGDPIYTVGFPGEANDLNTIQPIATYKDGTISALRPFDPDRTPASSQTNVVIQHNFNTSGGTSGSPVFNNSGKVIGIHNSGEYEFIRNSDGTVTRVPVASIGYAIRIDQRTMVENCFMTSFSSIPPCQDAKLKLLNNSTTSIYYFYIKPSSSTTWSSDLLGTKTIISGGSMNFTGIPAGTYDLRVQNQGKTLGKTIYNQDLEDCHSYTWTITSLSSSY